MLWFNANRVQERSLLLIRHYEIKSEPDDCSSHENNATIVQDGSAISIQDSIRQERIQDRVLSRLLARTVDTLDSNVRVVVLKIHSDLHR